MLSELLDRLRACEWVDLTHAFAPGIPHYADFPDEERTVLFHFDPGVGERGSGFLAHQYRHIGQWGTHMDPPSHFTRGGRSQDEVGVAEMILPLVVIDVAAACAQDADFACDRADLAVLRDARSARVPVHSPAGPASVEPRGPEQLLHGLGDTVWQWTRSEFQGYPGFRADPYPEYSEQFFGRGYRVLRGGAWLSSPRVATAQFRNWDHPERRHIFSGLRLARDL